MNQRVIFSETEKKLFKELVSEFRNIIELKKNDVESIRKKMECWNVITERFNSQQGVIKRSPHQLKKLWNNMKVRGKVERMDLPGTMDPATMNHHNNTINLMSNTDAGGSVEEKLTDASAMCVVSLNNHQDFLSDPLSSNSDSTTFLSITVHEGDEASEMVPTSEEATSLPGANFTECEQSGSVLSTNGQMPEERHFVDNATSTVHFINNGPPSIRHNHTLPAKSIKRNLVSKNAPSTTTPCALKRKMTEFCLLEHKAKMELYQLQRETEELKKQAAAAKLQLLNEKRQYLALKRRMLELGKPTSSSPPPSP